MPNQAIIDAMLANQLAMTQFVKTQRTNPMQYMDAATKEEEYKNQIIRSLLSQPVEGHPVISADEEAIEEPLFSPSDAWNIGKVGVAAAAKGAMAASPMLGMVFGKRASAADLAALARAQKNPLESSASREHGGWYQGPDRQWKFEAPSGIEESSLIATQLRPNQFNNNIYGIPLFRGKEGPLRLPEILDYPALYQSYPELKEAIVRSTGLNVGMKGAADPTNKIIYLADNTFANLRSNLEHEIQHLIQYKEKFARGGTVQEFLPPWLDKARENVGSKMKELTKQIMGDTSTTHYDMERALDGRFNVIPRYKDIADRVRHSPYKDDIMALAEEGRVYNKIYDDAFKTYHNLAGEVEARLAELRMLLSQPQRTATHPLTQMDVPDYKQKILFSGLGEQ